MIKYCVDKWNKNHKKLKLALEREKELQYCSYAHLKKKWLKLSDEKRIRQYVDDELEFAREELIKALVVSDE